MESGQAANSMIEQKRARLILPDDAKKSLEFQNAVQMQIKQNAEDSNEESSSDVSFDDAMN